jgi:hypothetical protein
MVLITDDGGDGRFGRIARRTTMIEKHDTARELNLGELDAVAGGSRFHYVEMNGDTYAVSGNGKPVQVTHNWSGPLGWLLN